MSSPVIDHVVILVPHDFLKSPPSWLSDAFTLYPGGTHVDGATANTLVLLPDGSYLEFIAFVPGADPALRQRHRWGHKKEGTVVDWALTIGSEKDTTPDNEITGESAFRKIQQRVKDAKAGLVYHDLVKGGRQRLDGVQLKWAISSAVRDEPDGKRVEPGQVPFWCLDDTARHLRVPYQEGNVSRHESGVTGVAEIRVQPAEDIDQKSIDAVLTAVLGEQEHGEWRLGQLSNPALHPGGRVTLAEQLGQKSIIVSFYTGNNAWAGKTIGGKVGDFELEFKLVG